MTAVPDWWGASAVLAITIVGTYFQGDIADWLESRDERAMDGCQ